MIGITQRVEEFVQGRKHHCREAQWNNVCYAKIGIGHAGHPGALTVAYMCMKCKHMPKDEFVCCAVVCHGKRTKSSQRMAGTWCANGGTKYDNSG